MRCFTLLVISALSGLLFSSLVSAQDQYQLRNRINDAQQSNANAYFVQEQNEPRFVNVTPVAHQEERSNAYPLNALANQSTVRLAERPVAPVEVVQPANSNGYTANVQMVAPNMDNQGYRRIENANQANPPQFQPEQSSVVRYRPAQQVNARPVSTTEYYTPRRPESNRPAANAPARIPTSRNQEVFVEQEIEQIEAYDDSYGGPSAYGSSYGVPQPVNFDTSNCCDIWKDHCKCTFGLFGAACSNGSCNGKCGNKSACRNRGGRAAGRGVGSCGCGSPNCSGSARNRIPAKRLGANGPSVVTLPSSGDCGCGTPNCGGCNPEASSCGCGDSDCGGCKKKKSFSVITININRN